MWGIDCTEIVQPRPKPKIKQTKKTPQVNIQRTKLTSPREGMGLSVSKVDTMYYLKCLAFNNNKK